MEIDPRISTEKVWKVLLEKISHPDRFLDVKDVVARISDDGLGTYREMTTCFMTATGKPERRVIENIYALEDKLEVLFIVIGDENEHVNAIITNPDGSRKLEFFLRNATTKERVPWDVPKFAPLTGVKKVLDKAASLQEEDL